MQDSFPGWGDPLEEGMAIHSNILAWRIPWTEEPGGLQSMGSQSQRWPKQLSTACAHLLIIMETFWGKQGRFVIPILQMRKPSTWGPQGTRDLTKAHSWGLMELVPRKHFLFSLNYYDFSNLFTVLLNLFSFFSYFLCQKLCGHFILGAFLVHFVSKQWCQISHLTHELRTVF